MRATDTRSLDEIKQMQIFLPNGQLKSIASLAHVQLSTGEAEIQREDMQNMGVVEARLDNRDLGSAIKEIQQKVSKQISLPQGYSIEYGGAYAEQQQSFHELLDHSYHIKFTGVWCDTFYVQRLSHCINYFIDCSAWYCRQFYGLYFTGTPLNVGSYTGLIMIVGIIGENAIFTFLQFRESYKER